MNMERLISPVLIKEIRERFRTFRGPLILVLYLMAMGAVILGVTFLANRSNPDIYNPDDGTAYFVVLSFLQLAMIGFVTPGLTAWVISNERERQTLNILLTTQLSPSSIILSKLLASLSFMTLLVFSTLPLYSIVTLYGGISPEQVAGVFAFYFLNMVFFGSVGVFLSTWIRRSSVATVTAYGVIFALAAATGFLSEFLDQAWHIPPSQGMPYVRQEFATVWFLRSINPVFVMASLFGGLPENNPLSLLPWQIYTLFYAFCSMALLWLSIYLLHPVRKGLLPFLRGKKA